MTAIAQNPGHVTATFIVAGLQGPLFARGVLRRPCHSAASSRSVALPFLCIRGRARSLPSSQRGAQWERALRALRRPLLPLPAKALELNPVENIWQFMRENWLSNRIFTAYSDISTTAATLGTNSQTSPGSLRPSACVTGLTGFGQRDLVISC